MVTVSPPLPFDDEVLIRCSCCRELKPPDAFHRCSRRRNGRDLRCRVCKARQGPRVFSSIHYWVPAVLKASEVEIAWVAGILEGEGNFRDYASNERFYPTIRVHMSDQDVIERLAQVTGFGTVKGPFRNGFRKDGRPCSPMWGWTVARGGQVLVLMKAILPHMGLRRSARIRTILETWYSLRSDLPE